MLVGGPGSLGIVGSHHEIEAIAELGVALLLFSLGLEFSIERLKGLGSKPLLGGAIQVVVTVAAGTSVALLFGLEMKPAFVLGAIGRISGVVSDDVYALVVSVTIASFIISAFVVPVAPALADRLARLLGQSAIGETELDDSLLFFMLKMVDRTS